MKAQFEITDKSLIDEILKKQEYGTLALCKDNIPYSVPINYVSIEDTIYFHGSKKGKKMEYIEVNSIASFSVVEPFSMIQSYFSSTENLACPATQFFQSVSIYGKIVLVEEYDEKVKALQALMEKLQPEGHYKSLCDIAYEKMIGATQIFKLIPEDIKGKIKLGQHLPNERFEMILKHLKERGTKLDLLTLKQMKNIKQ